MSMLRLHLIRHLCEVWVIIQVQSLKSDIDGYNFSIAGGGRYDKMIGKFCGQDVSACGFSIGFERIITILKDSLRL